MKALQTCRGKPAVLLSLACTMFSEDSSSHVAAMATKTGNTRAVIYSRRPELKWLPGSVYPDARMGEESDPLTGPVKDVQSLHRIQSGSK